ncbi:hypothetical protein EJ08DRAFT_648077 [Tothia fuscella]|uniref:Uncharacterized protein n=1 Tax=Tothia fuscella TaxID=1048955 RepID=A0A9P4NWT4_9PEZI|nr:hypothetical protein EJ08DRAFT_648077 [Tothia fuscella]
MARGGAGQFMNHLFADDEELGKKDDDHRPGKMNSWHANIWNGAPSVRYRSRKRWMFLLGAVFFIWVFIHWMPADILEPMDRQRKSLNFNRKQTPSADQSPSYGAGVHVGREGIKVKAPAGPPPRGQENKKAQSAAVEHYYDGDIRFYSLPYSLHEISITQGYRRSNRNILFAASNLKSASVLIPLACEMAKWQNNHVHVAFMGRNDLTVDEILEINGVDKNHCKAYWHDARPDYAKYSSDFRAEAYVASAVDHIQSYMHPQAVITDDSIVEDSFFVRQLRLKSVELGFSIIEIPQDKSDRLKWIARLEARSLAAWHMTNVDVLVHSPVDASGSLIRLLKSLSAADYSGLTPPRITIELAPEVDVMTRDFVESFAWPPKSALQPIHTSQLNVRHRIPGQKLSTEEASVRFLESFYPATPNNHVLLLAPNAQLSPMYYQYLKYHLLQYKYSTVGNAFSDSFLGISLELPALHLNATSPFTPPDIKSMDEDYLSRTKPVNKHTSPPFLWQAPNSNAALYFGEKWIELHSFLQHRLTKFHSAPNSAPRKKTISESSPAWTEYCLEYMRARGYSMLYPASSPDTEPLVTVHKELYHPPEEFTKKNSPADSDRDELSEAPPVPPNNEPFLVSKNPFSVPPVEEHTKGRSAHSQPLHAILPFAGEDPDTGSIPHLTWDGALISPLLENDVAEAYAETFRQEVGGCEADAKGRKRKISWGSARDLFCYGDDEDAKFLPHQEKGKST